MDTPHLYLALSAFMFSLGALGVTIRRNPVVMFMCIELMLNASNLALAVFSRYSSPLQIPSEIGVGSRFGPLPAVQLGGPADGSMFIFLVMTIAAAEAVVGLAIIIAIFRSRSVIDVDDLSSLKG
jgi:NADH-quinone oxidoreductase subunit K